MLNTNSKDNQPILNNDHLSVLLSINISTLSFYLYDLYHSLLYFASCPFEFIYTVKSYF